MGKTKLAVPAISLGIAAIALIFLALAVIFLFSSTEPTALKKGDQIPPVTIALYDGSTLTIPGNKPLVIHFWASWCSECRKEAPIWKGVEYDDVLILWISYKDVESKSLEALQKWGITFPAGKDPGGKLARLFGVTGVPETYFITADGVLLHRHIGPMKEGDLHRFLQELKGK